MALMPNKQQPVAPQPVVPQVAVTVNIPKTMQAAEAMFKEELVKAFGNKSNAIRGLSALGFKKGQIAKKLEIIYQHARNVLARPLKREIKEARDAKAVTANTSNKV